jgi:hypothetical protein
MNQLGVPIINVFRLIAAAGCSLIIVTPALAHHGGGTFDNTKTIELTGTLTRLELILNSEKLHVVERFSLDTAKMDLTRSYIADKCKEQAFVDYSKAAPNRK